MFNWIYVEFTQQDEIKGDWWRIAWLITYHVIDDVSRDRWRTVAAPEVGTECVAGPTAARVGAVGVRTGLVAQAVSSGALVDICKQHHESLK